MQSIAKTLHFMAIMLSQKQMSWHIEIPFQDSTSCCHLCRYHRRWKVQLGERISTYSRGVSANNYNTKFLQSKMILRKDTQGQDVLICCLSFWSPVPFLIATSTEERGESVQRKRVDPCSSCESLMGTRTTQTSPMKQGTLGGSHQLFQ